MNCPAMPPGGGSGMKFRNPFRPKTRKITPARYRAIAEAVLITGFSFWTGSHSMASIILMSIQLMMYTSWRFRFFYDARLSRHGPRLARNDEGDARADEVRSRWYGRDRARSLGFRRAGNPAAQRAFAGQYDRPDRRFDPRFDQYRRGPSRGEGPGQPGRERRRPPRADRRPHPTRQGPHRFSLSKAFR